MQPIVNGLQDTYSDSITFLSYNAQDGGDGEAIFQNLGLRGHPGVVIFSPAGDEIYRQLGIVDDVMIRDILDNLTEP